MGAKEKFESYLKSVCKNEEIRNYVIDYYNALGEKMGDVSYSKEDFETITINDKTIEQDIVKDLFSKQESATAQEVFAYLFENNIKELVAKGPSGFNKGVDGYYDPVDDILAIKLKPEKMFASKDNMDKDKKTTLFHELSHIFELRSFENGKILNTGLSKDYGYVLDKNRTPLCREGNLTNSGAKQENKSKNKLDKDIKRNKLPNMDEFILDMEREGSKAISEIYNEVFARDIYGDMEIKHENFNVFDYSAYKENAISSCEYVKDYEVLRYMMTSVGEDFLIKNRFNYKKITEELKNLNVSEDFLNQVKQETKNLLRERGEINKKEKPSLEESCSKIDDMSPADLLLFNLGIGSDKRTTPFQTSEKQKCLMQALLIENYKNNIIQQLNDPLVVKDKQFFERINKDLQQFSDATVYPAGKTTFKQLGYKPTMLEEKNVDNTEIYTMADYAKEGFHGAMSPYQSFSELIDAVNKSVEENKDTIPNLESSMTFLTEQKEILQKQKYLQAKQAEDCKIYKDAVKEQNEKLQGLEQGENL